MQICLTVTDEKYTQTQRLYVACDNMGARKQRQKKPKTISFKYQNKFAVAETPMHTSLWEFTPDYS